MKKRLLAFIATALILLTMGLSAFADYDDYNSWKRGDKVVTVSIGFQYSLSSGFYEFVPSTFSPDGSVMISINVRNYGTTTDRYEYTYEYSTNNPATPFVVYIPAPLNVTNGKATVSVSGTATSFSVTIYKSSPPVTEDDYTSIYQDGYEAGETAGEATGYQNGYEAGETAGYQNGYTAGETAGQEAGYNTGYEAGYNKGLEYGSGDYNAGYQAGKADGIIKGQQDADILSSVLTGFFDGLTGFFDEFMQVGIGNMTIYSLLFLALFAFFILLIVKIIRGS